MARPNGTIQLQEFWRFQEARTPENFAKKIVGEFEGSAYLAGLSGANLVEKITLRFNKDGTFETTLPNLVTGRTNVAETTDASSSSLYKGHYLVPGPSQLILSPGPGVTTVTPSLVDGVLTFFYLPARMMIVVFRKEHPQKRTSSEITGAYVGISVPVDPKRQPVLPGRENFELVLTDGGGFTPRWLDNSGKRTVFAHETYDGRYLFAPNGKLVLYAHFGGSDYVGGAINPLFDWFLDGMNLHMTAFDSNESSHLVVTIDGSSVVARPVPAASSLTNGTFRGSAFRAWQNGEIKEIPNIWIRFEADGTYHTNWIERLRKDGDPYYPQDGGRFLLASPRHLLLAELWKSENEVIQDVTTDFILKGDQLCFTSTRRKAYFVLTRSVN